MVEMGIRRPYQPAPEPDDESDPLDEVTLEVTIRGLNRFMKEAARRADLDARLDDYLAKRGPRPEEENDDPALDHQ